MLDLALCCIDWGTHLSSDVLTIFKVTEQAGCTLFEMTIIVNEDLKWKICIQQVELRVLPATLVEVPPIITSLSILRKLVTYLEFSAVCIGNPDQKFMSLASARKGKFYGVSGVTTIFLFTCP